MTPPRTDPDGYYYGADRDNLPYQSDEIPPVESEECETCLGEGHITLSSCCGNYTNHGECRGECVVQKQEICDDCGGAGRIILISTNADVDASAAAATPQQNQTL